MYRLRYGELVELHHLLQRGSWRQLREMESSFTPFQPYLVCIPQSRLCSSQVPCLAGICAHPTPYFEPCTRYLPSVHQCFLLRFPAFLREAAYMFITAVLTF